MSDRNKNSSCQMGCWALAAGVGLLTAIMLIFVGKYAFMPAVFLGLLAFVLLGLLFSWLFCAPLPAQGSGTAASKNASASVSAASTTATASATGAAVAASSAAAATTSTSVSDADAKAADKAAADKAAADKAAAVKAASDKAAADKKAAAAKAKADKAAADKAAAAKTASDKAASDKAAADKKTAAAKAKADKATAAKKAAADASASEDFDGDGTLEGADEGTKPELLTAARAGGADDLKRIKGIGPKLEGVCNDMGVYHFDQIAGWTADEMAWVNANLQGFKGRATRDDWVGQAKLLAAGGETEFSKRVDKGSVY